MYFVIGRYKSFTQTGLNPFDFRFHPLDMVLLRIGFLISYFNSLFLSKQLEIASIIPYKKNMSWGTVLCTKSEDIIHHIHFRLCLLGFDSCKISPKFPYLTAEYKNLYWEKLVGCRLAVYSIKHRRYPNLLPFS